MMNVIDDCYCMLVVLGKYKYDAKFVWKYNKIIFSCLWLVSIFYWLQQVLSHVISAFLYKLLVTAQSSLRVGTVDWLDAVVILSPVSCP